MGADPSRVTDLVDRAQSIIQPSPESPDLPVVSTPTGTVGDLAVALSDSYAQNPERAQFLVGYFYALAEAVRDNPEVITTTTQVQKLNSNGSSVVKTFGKDLGAFPSTAGTIANELMAEAIGTYDQKTMTPSERQGAVDGLMAIEWAIRKGANGG